MPKYRVTLRRFGGALTQVVTASSAGEACELLGWARDDCDIQDLTPDPFQQLEEDLPAYRGDLVEPRRRVQR